jgi:hypothetical protein
MFILAPKTARLSNSTTFSKHHTCETLYLVGDIIDGWKVAQNRWRWKQSHTNVIRRVLGHAKRGTRVIYVAGNHDEFLRPLIPYAIGFGMVEVVNQAEHIGLDGRHYLDHLPLRTSPVSSGHQSGSGSSLFLYNLLIRLSYSALEPWTRPDTTSST